MAAKLTGVKNRHEVAQKDQTRLRHENEKRQNEWVSADEEEETYDEMTTNERSRKPEMTQEMVIDGSEEK